MQHSGRMEENLFKLIKSKAILWRNDNVRARDGNDTNERHAEWVTHKAQKVEIKKKSGKEKQN